MSLKESGFLQAGAFQESKLEDDKKTIVDYYRSRGYIDAAVVDVIRSYEKDPKSAKNWLIVTIALKEGKQWLFGGISFEGNTIFPSEKLASYVSEKPGSILNYKKLVEEKAKIDDIYYESGYIFNQIDLIESRDEDKLTISYKVRIVEQDRAHIESLTIKGNTKTKDYVLYRELPLEVGDIFSKAKIMEGLRNLYNLQYFSAIEPQMFPGSAENLMDLVISVEEQNTADVEFGVTLSGLGSNDSSFPLSGIVKWDDKNFLGDGTDFSIEANGSPSTQTLTFGYTDNYFFGNRISGGFNFSIGHKVLTTGQDSIYPIFDNGVPDPFTKPQTGGYSISVIPAAYLMPYDNWDFSFGFSSGYTYHTPIGDLGLGAGLTLGVGMKDYDQDKYRPASEYLRTYDGIWRLGNKAIARVYLNDLDIAYNPSSGYYVNQKLTYAGLLPASMNLESQQYIRSDSKIEAYATLFNWHLFESWSWKMVLGAHSSFSALFPKPGQDLLVTDDWLYLDGMFNARGWDSFYGFEGKQLWDNWLELRMPIIEQVIWIDGFLDADALLTTGGLVNMTGSSPAIDSTRLSFSSLGLDDMAFSVGVGFRFSIAQFPFRFYFAWPFTIQNGAVKWMKTSPGLVISITQTLN
jgi:outer membrane protein assembly complex, YaeT protein